MAKARRGLVFVDPVSQAALGAIAARSVAPSDMGRGVVVAGAVLGAGPDIDVLFSVSGDFFDNLVHHRGLTHSLVVLAAAGPLMGHWLWRRFGGGGRWRRQHLWWLAIATLALFSHPLLDWLTPYGTQLLAPFSDRRFAVDAMPIIDPLYTLILLAGLGAGALMKAGRRPKFLALAALALSSVYLAYAWAQNHLAEQLVAEQLAGAQLRTLPEQSSPGYEIRAFPTILQVHYRRVVVRSPDEVRVGYLSTWSPCPVEWGHAGWEGEDAGRRLAQTAEGRIFDWFTSGWTYPSVQRQSDGFEVTLSDLRYGATLDPRHSFFSTVAWFDPAWRLIEGPVGRWSRPDADRFDWAGLFAAAYGVDCPAGEAP